MTDPISGQMASPAVHSIVQQGGDVKASGGASFQDALTSSHSPRVDQADPSSALNPIGHIEPSQASDPLDAVQALPTDDFIQGLLRDETDITAMMERCLRGESFAPDEMLQMQALIYSYSQRVDLTTKVVEKATSGIQQVMNTQV